MNIAIVTDSTSDITSELAMEHDIHVVPAILVVEGRSLEDGKGISREELYQRLPAMKTSPTTASPSSGTFQHIYEAILNKGADHIISIHVSSLLSGIYNAALVAAKAFGSRVHVVDSCHVSFGMGFQVLAAAHAARMGRAISEILIVIEEIRKHIHLVAMLDTLEYARRSGRISWAQSSISNLFQIKPFVGIENGIVVRMGETRTRQKGIERLSHMLSELGPLEHLAVLHTNAEDDALQFIDHFKSIVANNTFIINVTSIIGVHVGPKGLGFVAVTG
ncbi:MAG TPA: DegV family protein [Anaerolineales bacterium]